MEKINEIIKLIVNDENIDEIFRKGVDNGHKRVTGEYKANRWI